ncbi:hypothetical protein QFC22_003596 [Naganishia vaughanmartiniae]|uniref:Uncharacterized protein n=1 Tax=Naganishia vaughanmartiniae TaxID=1424756 RepID=A0ACC2X672_9TREE|nr:hypothetical protein QFC22_003596 [Naganishia vaughanmartiniae]
MTLKIAIAQTSPFNGANEIRTEDLETPAFNVFSNIAQNLSVISRTAEVAKHGGSELVVFPEYFTQGSLDGRSYLAEPAKWILEYLQQLARRLGISIAGTIVELEDSNGTASQPQISPFLPSDDDNAGRQSWKQYISREYPETFEIDGTADISSTNIDHHRSNDEKDIPNSSSLSDAAASTESAGKPRQKKLINVAYFFQAGTGEVIGRYVKKNLWISERFVGLLYSHLHTYQATPITPSPETNREYLHPGTDDHAVFTWNGITVGFLICWDLAHPLAAQELAKQGVDLVLVPTYWLATDSQPPSDPFDPPEDYEYNLVQSLSYTRAFETETVLVMCNAGPGAAPGLMGGSGVWMPFKGKLKGRDLTSHRRGTGGGGGDDGTELSGYEVDLGLLSVARQTYKIREDWKAQLET